MTNIGNIELKDGYVLRGKHAGMACVKIINYFRKKYVGNPLLSSIDNVDNNLMIEALKNVTDDEVNEKVNKLVSIEAEMSGKVSLAEHAISRIKEKSNITSDDQDEIIRLEDEIYELKVKMASNQSNYFGLLMQANKSIAGQNIELEEEKVQVLEQIAACTGVNLDDLWDLDEPKKEEMIENFYNEPKNGMKSKDGQVFQAFSSRTRNSANEESKVEKSETEPQSD